MRNLKRALSLALASVMLLGMMVVGTSAASYTDVDENDNVEAIEVLNAVNVMIGRQGNFEPDEAVNRHEMAVIMAKLVLGVDTADSYVGSHPYTDVVPWADKYVAACYENGLVYGKSATTYNGNDPLTAVEAAAMMLRALGYKDLNKGYQGDWRAPITAMANQIRLFSGVASNPNEKLNRNQVAQLALNTLKSPMVNLIDGTFDVTNGEGQVVITGGSREYKVISSREAYAYAINDVENQGNSAAGINGATVELGEHLYNGKLRLNNNDTDAFGRPARHWEYDGKAIGSYVKEELLRETYTKKVTGKDLYDLLTKSTIEDKSYNFRIYVDGEDRYSATNGINGVNTVFNTTQMNKDNKAGVGGTGKGVRTEVYVDSGKKEVTIAIINTYLARAKTDYNEKQDEVTLNVYGIDRAVAGSGAVYFWKNVSRSTDQKEPITVYGEDFAITNVAENDAYLVTVAEGEIQTMTPAEILSAVTLSAFGTTDFVITGGTQYDYASTAQYDVEVLDEYTGTSATNLKDLQYNVYLDKYGYLIGVDLVDDVNNYVFITGVDSKTSNLAAKNYEANAIFLDGTMKTITFNTEKSTLNTTSVLARGTKTTNDWALANTWCTYTVNNDGVYTLKQVALPAAAGGSAKDADNKTVSYGAGDSIVGLRTSAGNAVTKIGQYWDQHDGTGVAADTDSVSKDINVKRVSLRGSEGTADVRNDFKFVYGNKNTVYLNAEVKGIYTGAAKAAPRGVISKVSSVTTGVENANLEVLSETAAISRAQNNAVDKTMPITATNAAYGSYVLYGRDGYVIAAVTVARDASATENLVYIDSSKVKREEYNGGSSKAAGDGMWTWYRDAVKDGERVTLTEVGDGLSILKSLVENNWYVISYNAEGEVIGATHAVDDVDVSKNYTSSDKTLEKTMVDAGSKTVLYERAQYGNTKNETAGCPANHTAQDIYSNKGPVLKGNTFYSETEDKTGFFVDESVKVVIIQTNRNASTTQFLSGMSALENVVAKLNKHENDEKCNVVGCKDYHYEVSALIENGRGKVVIINDLHKTGDDGSYTGKVNTYTRNGIRFLINSDKAGDLDTTGRVDRYGDLTVFVPKAKARANWLPAEITVEVFVNDVFVDVAEYDNSKDTNRFYAYTLNDWALDTAEDDILVEVTWKDSGVKTPADVTLSGDKAGYTVKVNGAAYDATATYYVGDEVVVTPISGYTVKVNGTAITEKETYSLTAAGLTVSAVQDKGPVDLKAENITGNMTDMTGVTGKASVSGGVATITLTGDKLTENYYHVQVGTTVDFVVACTDKTVTFPYTLEGEDAADIAVAIDVFGATGTPNRGRITGISLLDGGMGPYDYYAPAAPSMMMARMIVPENSFSQGEYWTVKIDSQDLYGVVNAKERVKFDNASLLKLVNIIKKPNWASTIDAASMKSLPTVAGDISAEAGPSGINQINVALGQPKAVGVKLPTAVTITNTEGDTENATAAIVWTPNDEYAKATSGYTCKIAIAPAAGKSFDAAGVTVNGTGTKLAVTDGKVNVDQAGKDITPDPDAGKVTLTLSEQMWLKWDENKIEVYVQDEKNPGRLICINDEADEYIRKSDSQHVADFKIPEGAEVQIHVKQGANNDLFELRDIGHTDSVVGWKVGTKTYMTAEHLKSANDDYTAKLIIEKMTENVELDVKELNKGRSCYPAYPIYAHNGVVARITNNITSKDTSNDPTVTGDDPYFMPIPLNSTTNALETLTVGFWVSNAGKDDGGKGDPATYVIVGDQYGSTPMAVADSNAQAGYTIWGPTHLWPATQVIGNTNSVYYQGGKDANGDATVSNYAQDQYVRVDLELSLEQWYDSTIDKTSKRFIAVTSTKRSAGNFVEKDTVGNTNIVKDGKWTVPASNEAIHLYNAIEFTLGEDVKATLAGYSTSKNDGDANSGMFTAIAGNPQITSGKYYVATVKGGATVKGQNALIFTTTTPANQVVVSSDLREKGLGGNAGGVGEYKWVTDNCTAESQIWDKAEWQAWTKVTSSDNSVKDAFIVHDNKAEGAVFTDLGAVTAVTQKVVKPSGGWFFCYSSEANTVYIDPDVESGEVSFIDGEDAVDVMTVYAKDTGDKVITCTKGSATETLEKGKNYLDEDHQGKASGEVNIPNIGKVKVDLKAVAATAP